MVVSVFGGSGFVGRLLSEQLAREPGVSLRLLSRRETASATDDAIHRFRGDLLDLDSPLRVIVPGSVAINLAYQRGGTRRQNLKMAENLAEACRRNRATRLLHCSTAVVAGSAPQQVITEEVACRPLNEYQRTKLDIEHLLRERLSGHCALTILRPTAVMGPGGRNLVKLASELRSRNRLVCQLKAVLQGERRLHLVCVENVTAAIRFLALESQPTDDCFIVSDDDEPENNYRQISRWLADELGVPRLKEIDPPIVRPLSAWVLKRARPGNPPTRVYSGRKLAGRGFRKPLTLEAGVRLFARWWAAQQRRSGLN